MGRIRKKATMEQYIKAGAYYRLLKHLTVISTTYINNNITQSAKAADAFIAVHNKISQLETKLGFENCLALDCPELRDREFCSVFYGDINVDKSNDVDKAIHNEIINILNELINETKIKERG
jgi:hypothetical protein